MSSVSFSELSSFGFSVFPVRKYDKRPAVSWSSYQSNRPTKQEITSWDEEDYNVGVVCGAISNLIVIDVDSAEAQALIDSLDLPPTPTVLTHKGRHYYFRWPTGEFGNRVRVQGVALDVRGEGGYVVGAGSVHPEGSIYQWEISPSDCALAELPASLKALLTTAPTVVRAQPGTSIAIKPDANENKFSVWIGSALDRAISDISKAQAGERNDTLNRVSFVVASLVAATNLAWEPYAEQLKRAALSIGLSDMEATSTIASAWAGGKKQPCRWIETAQRYVYVSARGQFYNVAARQGITESAFNRTHNSERQWEKGAMATFLTDQDFMDKAFDLRFDPAKPTGVYVHDDERWLNTYVDPAIAPLEGDASPFVEFIEHLIPNADERAHLLQMIAWTVRHPGKKLGHALLLRTERQGVGKSMLIAIWRELLGTKNTRLTTTEEITGNFQSFIEGNLLVLVEELNVAFGMQGYNRIKNLITGETAEINEKFVSSRERPNHASFVFLTNLPEPILIEDSDRRFFFIDSPAVPREPAFYSDFANWWKCNLGILRWYLDAIDLKGFNPFAPPPETEAKRTLQLASRSPLEQEIAQAMAERRFPFSRDVVRLEEVKAAIPAAYSVPLQRLKGAMRTVGAVPLGAHRANGEWMTVGNRAIYVDGRPNKPSLWAVLNTDYWQLASPQTRVEEFSREIGLLSSFDGLGIGIRHASSNAEIYRDLSNCPTVHNSSDAEIDKSALDLLNNIRSRMLDNLGQLDNLKA